MNWPVWSLSFTPLDVALRGYVKDKNFSTPDSNTTQLMKKKTSAIPYIRVHIFNLSCKPSLKD